jgi:hypothetical protein
LLPPPKTLPILGYYEKLIGPEGAIHGFDDSRISVYNKPKVDPTFFHPT